ncbi:hypothetical protein KC360_g74 [Hortaea werneckii]|nr:hypothetical protein KC360_g74 [Hortaea werneckii]
MKLSEEYLHMIELTRDPAPVARQIDLFCRVAGFSRIGQDRSILPWTMNSVPTTLSTMKARYPETAVHLAEDLPVSTVPTERAGTPYLCDFPGNLRLGNRRVQSLEEDTLDSFYGSCTHCSLPFPSTYEK